MGMSNSTRLSRAGLVKKLVRYGNVVSYWLWARATPPAVALSRAGSVKKLVRYGNVESYWWYGHEQLYHLQQMSRASSVKKLVRYGNVESYWLWA